MAVGGRQMALLFQSSQRLHSSLILSKGDRHLSRNISRLLLLNRSFGYSPDRNTVPIGRINGVRGESSPSQSRTPPRLATSTSATINGGQRVNPKRARFPPQTRVRYPPLGSVNLFMGVAQFSCSTRSLFRPSSSHPSSLVLPHRSPSGTIANCMNIDAVRFSNRPDAHRSRQSVSGKDPEADGAKEGVAESPSRPINSVMHIRELVNGERNQAHRHKLRQRITELRGKLKLKTPRLVFRENIHTIPNYITLSRLLFTPIIGYWISEESYRLAFWGLAYAGLSDLVDGYLARRWNQKTVLGTLLDPLCDKVLMTTLTLSLAVSGDISGLLAGLIIGRDVALVGGAAYYRWKSLPKPKSLSKFFDPALATIEMKPTAISKWNTAFQLILMGSIITFNAYPFLYPAEPDSFVHVLSFAQVFVAATTVASGASYVVSNKAVEMLSRMQRKHR